MSAWSRRAPLGPVLAAVVLTHAVTTLFSVAALGQLGVELAAGSRTTANDNVWLLTLGMRVLPAWSNAAQWAALAYLLLVPLLTQLVLGALARRATLGAQLRFAQARYGRALALAALRWLFVALALFGSYRASEALPALVSPSALLEELVRAVSLLLGVLGALWLSTVTDLAAAKLALGQAAPTRQLLARGARLAGLRSCALHGACIAGGIAAFALGDALARLAPWSWLAIATQQTLALTVALTRAQWLAIALGTAQAHSEIDSL